MPESCYKRHLSNDPLGRSAVLALMQACRRACAAWAYCCLTYTTEFLRQIIFCMHEFQHMTFQEAQALFGVGDQPPKPTSSKVLQRG